MAYSRTDLTPYDLVNALFCDYVKDITGRVVILQQSNTPQPIEQYIAIRPPDVQLLQHDVVDFVDTDGAEKETVRGLGILNYIVVAYGGDVYDDLAKIQNSFQTTKFIFGMEKYGFGLSDKGTITNTSGLLVDARFERRAELKCSFYHATSDAFTAEFFNHFIMGVVSNGLTTYINTEDINKRGDVCDYSI